MVDGRAPFVNHTLDGARSAWRQNLNNHVRWFADGSCTGHKTPRQVAIRDGFDLAFTSYLPSTDTRGSWLYE